MNYKEVILKYEILLPYGSNTTDFIIPIIQGTKVWVYDKRLLFFQNGLSEVVIIEESNKLYNYLRRQVLIQ